MKKSEFKKMLRREKHPITKGIAYEIIFILIFLLLCATMIFLQFEDILPSGIGLILDGMLIIIAAPYFILDIKRDKKIKEMYEHYQKENKVLEVKDNSKMLKVILVIEIIATLIVGGFILINYGFNMNHIPNNDQVLSITTKSGEVVETEFYSFDNGNFSLKIPTEFFAMDQEIINLKYPNGNPPSFVLTNDKASINIAVNVTDNVMRNSDIKECLKLMEKTFSDMGTKAIETNFFERDGHEIGEIKFISQAVDTEIYNHMIVFSDGGLQRIVSFNCTKELQEDWKEVGDFIIRSIKF